MTNLLIFKKTNEHHKIFEGKKEDKSQWFMSFDNFSFVKRKINWLSKKKTKVKSWITSFYHSFDFILMIIYGFQVDEIYYIGMS